MKAAASSEQINDENNGELATGSNAKKSKLNGGRRALLEIAWWTGTYVLYMYAFTDRASYAQFERLSRE